MFDFQEYKSQIRPVKRAYETVVLTNGNRRTPKKEREDNNQMSTQAIKELLYG